MVNISIATVGDCSCDSILDVDHDDAGLLCSLQSHKCEITFNYGEKISVAAIHKGFGGSALNCALGFKKLGLETRISTFVGNDDDGKKIVTFLNENQIDLKSVAVQGATNESSIINFKGERTVFSYHAPRDYGTADIAPADWIYLCSAGKGSSALQDKILKCRDGGAKIAFNPGSWQLKNLSSFAKLLNPCEVFILNRLEADQVVGLEGKIKEQLAKICGWGVKIAVITDGKNGAYFGNNGSYIHINSVSANVVDSTGAGDSFSSGFVAALTQAKSLEESAKWGMVNSGSVVEKIGANEGLLTADEIEKRTETIKSFKITLL